MCTEAFLAFYSFLKVFNLPVKEGFVTFFDPSFASFYDPPK